MKLTTGSLRLKKTIVTALALGALVTAGAALAQTNDTGSTTPPHLTAPLSVVFPIAELGGCTSKDACRVYCDDPANHDACFAYAQTHGLMHKDEVDRARAYLQAHPIVRKIVQSVASSTVDAILATQGGPGGCTTRDACKTFCNDAANSAVCLQFAKDHKLMSVQEIEKAKKLHAQVGPGGCKGEECKIFCQDNTHQRVCVAFAEQNGFISKDEATKRLEITKISSTTKQFLPIHVDGERMGSTTTQKPKLNGDTHLASTTRPNTFKEPQRPPQPQKPPHPTEGSSTSEQSGSVFFSILHFFGF